LVAENPNKFKSMGSATDPVQFYTIFTGMILVQLFYWGTKSENYSKSIRYKRFKRRIKRFSISFIYQNFRPHNSGISWFNSLSYF
tara:strand:+ start:1082 stop:1336 length:255 start_codon:yes stop_codon:yes gene_type:complete